MCVFHVNLFKLQTVGIKSAWLDVFGWLGGDIPMNSSSKSWEFRTESAESTWIVLLWLAKSSSTHLHCECLVFVALNDIYMVKLCKTHCLFTVSSISLECSSSGVRTGAAELLWQPRWDKKRCWRPVELSWNRFWDQRKEYQIRVLHKWYDHVYLHNGWFPYYEWPKWYTIIYGQPHIKESQRGLWCLGTNYLRGLILWKRWKSRWTTVPKAIPPMLATA